MKGPAAQAFRGACGSTAPGPAQMLSAPAAISAMTALQYAIHKSIEDRNDMNGTQPTAPKTLTTLAELYGEAWAGYSAAGAAIQLPREQHIPQAMEADLSDRDAQVASLQSQVFDAQLKKQSLVSRLSSTGQEAKELQMMTTPWSLCGPGRVSEQATYRHIATQRHIQMTVGLQLQGEDSNIRCLMSTLAAYVLAQARHMTVVLTVHTYRLVCSSAAALATEGQLAIECVTSAEQVELHSTHCGGNTSGKVGYTDDVAMTTEVVPQAGASSDVVPTPLHLWSPGHSQLPRTTSPLNLAGTSSPRSSLDLAGTSSPRSSLDLAGASSPRSSLDVAGTSSPRSSLDLAGTSSPRSTLDLAGTSSQRSSLDVPLSLRSSSPAVCDTTQRDGAADGVPAAADSIAGSVQQIWQQIKEIQAMRGRMEKTTQQCTALMANSRDGSDREQRLRQQSISQLELKEQLYQDLTSKAKAMEASLSERDAKIADLESQVHGAQLDRQSMISRLDSAEQEAKELQQQLAAAQQQAAAMQCRVLVAYSELSARQVELASANSAKAQAQAQLQAQKQLKAEMAACMDAKAVEHKAELLAKEEQVQRAQQQHDLLLTELQSLQQQHQLACMSGQQLQADLHEARKQASQHEQQLRQELMSVKAAYEQQVLQLQQQQALENDVHAKDMHEARAACAAAQQQAYDLHASCSKLEQQMHQLQQQQEAQAAAQQVSCRGQEQLQLGLQAAHSQCVQGQNRVVELQQEHQMMQAQLQAAHAQSLEQTVCLEQLSGAKQHLEQQLAAAQQLVNQARQQHQAAAVELYVTGDQLSSTRHQLTTASSNLCSTEKQLQALIEEHNRAQQELDSARLQLASTTAERDSAQQQVASTTGELNTARQQLQSVREEGDAVQQQLSDCSQQLSTTRQQLQSVREERDAVQHQLSDCSQQLSTTRQQLQSVREERDAVQQQLSDCSQQLSTTRQQLRDAETSLSAANTMLQQEQQRVQQLQVQHDTALQQVQAQHEEALQQLQVQVNAALQQLAEKARKLQEVETESKVDMRKATQKLDHAEQQLSEEKEHVTQAKQQLRVEQERATKAEQQLKEEQERTAKAETARSEAVSAAEELKRKKQALNAALKTTEQQLHAASTRASQAEALRKQAAVERARTLEKVEWLQQQLDEKKVEVETLEQQAEETRAELETLKEELGLAQERAQKKAREFEAEEARWNEDMDDLRASTRDLKRQLAVAQQDHTEAQGTAVALYQALAAAQRELDLMSPSDRDASQVEEDLKAKLQEAHQQIAALELEVQDAEQRMVELRNDRQTDTEVWDSMVKGLRHEATKLQEQLEEMEKNYKRLKARKDVLQMMLDKEKQQAVGEADQLSAQLSRTELGSAQGGRRADQLGPDDEGALHYQPSASRKRTGHHGGSTLHEPDSQPARMNQRRGPTSGVVGNGGQQHQEGSKRARLRDPVDEMVQAFAGQANMHEAPPQVQSEDISLSCDQQ